MKASSTTRVSPKPRRADAARGVLLALALLACAPAAVAHEGHDEHEHAAETAAQTTAAPQTPRLSYQSERVESVALIDARGLVVWVDDFAGNRPLAGLAVSARVAGGVLQAQEIEPGTYRVPLDLLLSAAQPEVELSLSLRGADWEEHYQGRLPRPPAAAAQQPQRVAIGRIAAAIAVLAALALTLAFYRRRRR